MPHCDTEDMHSLIATVVLLPLADSAPKPTDVKAGWVAFAIFLVLAIAVILIGWFLTRSLKRSEQTAERGGYDESPPKEN